MTRPFRMTALSLVVGALAFWPGAALADGGSLSAGNGVLWSDCRPYAYAYSVDIPADAQDWSLDVTVKGPDGLVTSSDFIYDTVTSGTSSFQLCGGLDTAGTYTLSGVVEYDDVNFNPHTFSLADGHFSLRLPRTRTSAHVNDQTVTYGQILVFKARSMDERPNGYFGTSYASVVLQKRTSGKWVNVRGTRTTTDSRGYVRFKVRYAQRVDGTARVKTLRSDEAAASVSSPIRLKYHS